MPGLFVLAVVTYSISWWGDFVYDDLRIIVADERVSEPGRWGELWSRSHWNLERGNNLSNWRPLASSSYAVNWWFTPASPWSFHLINTLLHGAVTLLVFSLSREVLRRTWPGAAAAALFAVHPVHAEAVANIIGRSELMAALFGLLAWRAHRHGRPVWAAVWLGVGVLCKESALPLVGVMVLDDALGRPGSPVRPRMRVGTWLPMMVVTAIYLAARWAVLGCLGRNSGMALMSVYYPLLD